MVIAVNVTGTSTTVSNLAPGTTYYYTIQSFNGSTAGPVSSVQSNTTVAGQLSNAVLIGGKLFLDGSKAAIATNTGSGTGTSGSNHIVTNSGLIKFSDGSVLAHP